MICWIAAKNFFDTISIWPLRAIQKPFDSECQKES